MCFPRVGILQSYKLKKFSQYTTKQEKAFYWDICLDIKNAIYIFILVN